MTRLAGFARSIAGRTIGGVATDFILQLGEINELIRLPAQFVSNHRGLRRDRRDHGDAHAFPLN